MGNDEISCIIIAESDRFTAENHIVLACGHAVFLKNASSLLDLRFIIIVLGEIDASNASFIADFSRLDNCHIHKGLIYTEIGLDNTCPVCEVFLGVGVIRSTARVISFDLVFDSAVFLSRITTQHLRGANMTWILVVMSVFKAITKLYVKIIVVSHYWTRPDVTGARPE